MTQFTDALTGMRAQAAAQIQGNGVNCDVKRATLTTDGTGRKLEVYNSLVSGGVNERMWIQPFTGKFGGNSAIQVQGRYAETSHLAFQAWGGVALIAKDRIMPSGGTFVYDVIESQLFETHRETMLKQVRRV
jgi:hypothetical protein